MPKESKKIIEAEFEETGETPAIPAAPVVLSLPGTGVSEAAPVVARPQPPHGGSSVPVHRNLYDHNH